MLFITQLIYIKVGQERIFDEFEDIAIVAMLKYNGQLLLRIRPDEKSFVTAQVEKPYEIHLVKFATENDFEKFLHDKERQHYLSLKEQSMRSVIVIKGAQV